MKSNEVLQREIQEAIKFEPMLHAAEIGVIVKNAIVTLTGNVDMLVKKTEALHAAKRIKGVAAVVDEIQVIVGKSLIISDQQIAENIVKKLQENHIVPQNTISITVADQWVTLDGILPWSFQRDVVIDLVKNETGIRGLTNNIKLKRELDDLVEKDLLKKAMSRHWALDPDDIDIQVTGATVQLSGTVGSLFQKEEAEKLAYKTPGVVKVVNHLKVDTGQPYLC